MSEAAKVRLLIVFACLEFVLAGVMIVYLRNIAIGASQVAMGSALLAIAVSLKKKSNG